MSDSARAGGHTSVVDGSDPVTSHRPREPLRYDELQDAYKVALEQERQLRTENQELVELVLHCKGRLMMFTQELDLRLAELARDRDRHATEREVAQVKVYP